MGVLARFKRELVDVDSEQVEQVFAQDGGEQLEYGFGVDFGVLRTVSRLSGSRERGKVGIPGVP